MNILLTNDDGYNAPGIKLLKELLSKYGKVVIFAPKEAMSCKSASITINTPLHYEKVDEDVFYLDGTPADCVSFALTTLNMDFDLVVSGCNNGWNLSYDTIYSGTIGACLESLTLRTKTVAISCDINEFDVVKENFDVMWEFINKNQLISDKYILNINFPHPPVKGIELTKEYYRKDTNYFTYFEDIKGYKAYRYMDESYLKLPGTDCYCVNNGIISVCPLMPTYFNDDLLNELKKKIKLS